MDPLKGVTEYIDIVWTERQFRSQCKIEMINAPTQVGEDLPARSETANDKTAPDESPLILVGVGTEPCGKCHQCVCEGHDAGLTITVSATSAIVRRLVDWVLLATYFFFGS